MSLFFTDQVLHAINENSLKLKTPVGDVLFEVKINQFPINLDSSSTTKSTKSNCFLNSWNTNNCKINCLRVRFDPILPSKVEVDSCFAFIWRIKAFENLDIKLNCFLKTFLEGYPETGESLIALSFEDQSTKLSIGTEDEEKLASRARNHDWVPHRFESEINEDNIRYLDNGIGLNFSLIKEEQLQIQFIIAW